MGAKCFALVILLLATVTSVSAVRKARPTSVNGWKEISLNKFVPSTNMETKEGIRCQLRGYYDNETYSSDAEATECFTELVGDIVLDPSKPLGYGFDREPDAYYKSTSDSKCTVICATADLSTATVDGTPPSKSAGGTSLKRISFFFLLGLGFLSVALGMAVTDF